MLRRKIVYLVDYDKETQRVVSSPDGLPQQWHYIENFSDEEELKSQVVEDLKMLLTATKGVSFSLKPVMRSHYTTHEYTVETVYISVDLGCIVKLPAYCTTVPVAQLIAEDDYCNLDVVHDCVL